MRHHLLLVLLLSTLVGKCYGIGEPAGDFVMGIANSSDISIGCLVATNDLDFSYPDTVLPKQPKISLQSGDLPQRQITYIEPLGHAALCRIEAVCWEQALDWETKHGVLSVYIFSKDTLDQRSWDHIRSSNGYIVRYDLTANDLNNRAWAMGYCIPFPPSIEMSNVKMYPPFEEIYEEWKD